MTGRIARRRRGGGSGVGLALIVVGALLLVGTLFGGFQAIFWPGIFIVPGLFLFWMVKGLGKSASILTIPATMITTLGLMLFAQNITGLWETWAYAWALLFPGSFGLGLAVYGELARKPTAEQWGEGMAKVGLAIFAVGALFHFLFSALGILGALTGAFMLPLLLILAGVWLMRRNRKPKTRYVTQRHYGKLGDGSDRLDSTLFQEERERV